MPPDTVAMNANNDDSEMMDVDVVEEDSDEILEIRAQIKALSKRKSLLAATLLNSSKIQSQLRSSQAANSSSNNNATTATSGSSSTSIENLIPLLAVSTAHSQSNIHRLSFGVTSFPFVDPNPEVKTQKTLLGIRFDIPSRHGSFHTPYYILLKRVGSSRSQSQSQKVLRVHRHTVPAFVPLQRYEETYLPLLDAGEESGVEMNGNRNKNESRDTNDSDPEDSNIHEDSSKTQDLHGLVAKVRHDLISWHLRRDALDHVCEVLDLPPATNLSSSSSSSSTGSKAKSAAKPETETPPSPSDEKTSPARPKRPKHNLTLLTLVSNDATQARLIWADDRVGRIKISASGQILRAVVIGREGRMKEFEDILCSHSHSRGGGSAVGTAAGSTGSNVVGRDSVEIMDLPERLKVMEQVRKKIERATRLAEEIESDEEEQEEENNDDDDEDDDEDSEDEQDNTGFSDDNDNGKEDGDTTMQK